MRLIAWMVGILVAISVLLPPQVKEVVYTYRSTKIYFWYPSPLLINGNLEFHEDLSIFDGSGVVKNIYGKSDFMCGLDFCKDFNNRILTEWNQEKNKRDAISKELSSFKNSISKAEGDLVLQDAFISDNSCENTVSGPGKPAFACGPGEEQDVAATVCVIRNAGPKLCEKAAKEELLDGDMPKLARDILARESCAAIVSEALGDEYSLFSKTEKRYTEDLPITLMSSFIGLFSDDAKNLFDFGVIAAKTKECMPGAIERCSNEYQGWQNELIDYRLRYSEKIGLCMAAAQKADSLRSLISSLNDKVSVGEREISVIEGRIRGLELASESHRFKNIVQSVF